MSDFYTHFRKHQYTTVLLVFLLLTDVVFFSVLLDVLYQYIPVLQVVPRETYVLLSAILALCWVLSNILVSSYQVPRLGTPQKIIESAVRAGLVYAALILFFLSLIDLKQGVFLNGEYIVVLFLFTLLPTTLFRCLMLFFYRFYRNLSFNHTPVVIIGCTDQGRRLYRFFVNTASLPHKFMGFFDSKMPVDPDMASAYKGDLEEVKEYCLQNNIKEIYYTLSNNKTYLAELADFADKHFIYLGIVPDMSGMEFINNRRLDTQLYDDGKIPVLSSRNVPLRLMINAHVKRAFDIVFSTIVLSILCVTVFPVIAIAIKMESRGPVFFSQLRPGKFNHLFWCYKFRTMTAAPHNEEQQATRNDNRITKVGAFLRKTSLDELPQFFNVLKGDMSVVGPRPNMVSQLDYYSQEIREYPLRHLITPGITGYAQVSGYRGETKEMHMMQKRVQYDLWYIENWTFLFDLKIIARTVTNIIKGEENAY